MNDKYFWLKADSSTEEITHEKFHELMRGRGHRLIHSYGTDAITLFNVDEGNHLNYIPLSQKQLLGVFENL